MTEAMQTDAITMDNEIVKWLPRVDMLFDSENDAYEFYSAYAEKVGFFVRRSTLWTTSKNIVTRRTFVCSREGFREKKKGSKEVKSPRPETRIGCQASMTIRLTPNGKYRVTEFLPGHNHQLATQTTIHMLRAKKMRRKARLARADLVDETVRTPEFETEDEAYEFYSMYAGKMGFSVRRASMTVNAENVITRRMFVCSREGFREKKKGTTRVKKPSPETRTGCPACMVIRIASGGKYHVSEFVTYHNHQLSIPSADNMVTSSSAEIDGKNEETDFADDSVKMPTSTDKIPGKQGRGCEDIGCHEADNKNLRSKRLKVVQTGDAGATLEYLQKMQNDNPSFFYAVMADEDGIMTNFFWADAKSRMDFNYFGDVVCFDTTYKVNGCGRPLALFIGLNHHKQSIIFGSALLYDESCGSFKWLFETFKTAMCGRQPKTVLTDRCAAISDAVTAVWPGTAHRFCVWHIYLHAAEQLNQAFHGSKTLSYDISRCLFEFEEEDEFLSAWQTMLEKYDLKDNQWLSRLFADREKWALVYRRDSFYADMKSVQQKETLNNELKKLLSPELGLLSFFEHYERILDERRFSEMQADVSAGQNNRKIPSMRILKQAANAYTPAAYKMFEREFEMYMDCMLYSCGEVGSVSEYKVTVEDDSKDHIVRFDSLDGSFCCSCKKFEFIGIQCRHVLKVLDFRNIKDLPPQYILKRWRKDAKVLSGNYGVLIDDDPQSSGTKRFNYLCRIFSIAAARAAKTLESHTYIEGQLDVLMEQVEQIMQTRHLEMSSLPPAPYDQNPVDCVVMGSLHHDKTNQASLLPCATDGLLSSRHSHPTICWGQFPAGPPE
ncbi:hypothetical protein J5N97_017863 [Dioscorea zingiberensis]|uniref:Protein FAR1-RELATED SEQUENCE n=1 Tax=Dioscorea zingiberensis TaxID=325984 RepID=A0A9D5CLW0_9LILI|nr:hypothetical protein J5N97_017863 [Dioscorea zingiberensis]